MNSSLGVLMLLAASFLPPSGVDSQTLDRLVAIRQDIEMVRQLFEHGVKINRDQLESALLAKADLASDGKVKTFEDLANLTGGNFAPPSAEQKYKGWFTFTNIVLVTGVILIAGACIALFGHYFLALILFVPLHVWHIFTWLASFATVVHASKFGDMSLAVGLPGVFGMFGASLMTYYLFIKNIKYFDAHPEYSYRLISALLAVTWSVSAVVMNSSFVGFMAIAAVMSAIGFFVGVIPGVVLVGFSEDKVIPRASVASGLILGLHVLLTVTGLTIPYLDVFRIGMLGLGSFVFYLSLLIMSNKWYCVDKSWGDLNWGKYLAMQLITVSMGVAALYIGTTFHMSTLLGVGGTFFYLYIIEKYYEIPWRGVGWVWSTLGLGVILYWFSVFAQANPEYFFM